MNYSEKDIERFWSKVDKEQSDTFYDGTRCWEWVGGLFSHGYGAFWSGEKTARSHRVSYELAFGEIRSSNLFVCHHCDNQLCVNPHHLFLGTAQDNIDDMKKKGRQALGESHGTHTHPESVQRGESVGTSKLTKRDVAEIRMRYGRYGKGGETSTALAKEFGVSQAQISNIVNKKLWKNTKN